MNDFQFPDAHVHTLYSRNDCQQPMSGYLDLLRSGQSAGFGFADHLHPPIEALSLRYKNMNVQLFEGEAYLKDIRTAQQEGLRAYAGIEITYEHASDDICARRAFDNDYDYRIASIHSVDGLWITRTYWQNVQPGTMFLDIVNRYYDAIQRVLELEWADVVAHIGVYRRFLQDAHPLMQCAGPLIAQREEEIAKACAQSGKIIEVNTSGLTKPGACTMPSQDFLIRYRQNGGEKICLSSDAHNVKDAHQCFTQTAQRLREIGFEKLFMPWSPKTPIAL